MLSFENQFEKRIPLSHGLVKTLTLLHEYRGKEQLFRQQTPQVLEALRQSAVIQSVESSNRIEGVVAKRGRVKQIVAEKSAPRDRPESEIAGYRDVLDTIHGGHDGIRLSNGVVKQLHQMLFAKTAERGGIWKVDANRIERKYPDGRIEIRFEPPPPHLTETLMTELHEGLVRTLKEQSVDPLLVIPAYILDFLCVHPFRDGNGRMARLLALLLLYQQGFGVGRFISLEKIIEGSKETYYETLHASSQGWRDGDHMLTPWTDYFLGTLVDAYRQFEERIEKSTTARGGKTRLINSAIDTAIGDFTAQEILAKCPTASVDLVRQILKQRKALGHIQSLGRGRSAKWRRIG